MLVVQKMVSFTAILVLLPFVFVSSSQHHSSETGNTKPGKGQTIHHELNPKLSFEITVHGFLLWTSMGFLMPVGILLIRMSNREECGRRLKLMFYAHATLQTLSVLLATAGAVMSIKNFESSFNNLHQRVGIALYGLIWLQALIGFLRPHRGTTGRSVWFFVHWLVGSAASIVGIINIYSGLQAYNKKTSRSTRLWTIIFTAEICFISFFYLFQDKLEYVQKQGVILGSEPIQPTDQPISPRSKPSEMHNEPCSET